MGQKDLTEKSLESYPDVFADIVNVFLYKGEQVVLAENLQAAPTETLYPAKHGRLRNQFHDVSKYEMHDGKIKVQYTLENETKAKWKTVLRKAGYGGAVYRSQYDGREVFPFVSMVLFWGKGHWQAPKSLEQLFDSDVAQKEYIDNIRLHVHEMAHLPQEVRDRFRSDMRIVVDFLAEGQNYIPSKQKIIHLEALLLMLNALTGDNRYEEIILDMQDEQNKMGGVSMCELLDKYETRGREAGMADGMAKGMANGMSLGVERVNELIKRLIGDGRSEEIDRAVSDKEYQNRLFEEYGL